MKRWRDGDAVYVPLGGTGSISCVGITAEDAAEAQSRRAPLGFRAEVADLIEDAHAARDRDLQATILNGTRGPRTGWGEAAWTAADLLYHPWFP